MTTIETIDTPTTIAATLVHDGHLITPRGAADVATLLDKASASPVTANHVQKARKAEATGSLGLYLEAVTFTSSGKPFTHMKFFIVGEHVYVYNRNVGDARANWRHRSTDSLAKALAIVQAAINKDTVKVFGHPVLVELTADDLSAVETDQMPSGRFRGEYRIQREFGKYDFEMDVVTSPIPDKLVKALRGRFVGPTP